MGGTILNIIRQHMFIKDLFIVSMNSIADLDNSLERPMGFGLIVLNLSSCIELPSHNFPIWVGFFSISLY